MEKRREKPIKKSELFFILVCWFVYVTAQLGRHSYNSTRTVFIDIYSIPRDSAGLPTTLFFFAYGAGNIFVGLMSGRYNVRITVSLALLGSAAINVAVFLGIDFVFIKYLWLLNGFLQAHLWPLLLFSLSKTVSREKMPFCCFVMSTASTGGTFLSYAVSSLFTIDVTLFRYTFLIGAILMALGAALWFVAEWKTEKAVEPIYEETKREEQGGGEVGITAGFIATCACFMLFSATSFAIDGGLTQWIPSILKDNYGLGDSLSILMTVVIPLSSIPTAAISVWFYSKTKSFALCAVIFFTVCAGCLAGVVFILGAGWIPVMATFLFIHIVIGMETNQMSTQAPLVLRSRLNSGFVAGVLNGCCFVGSAIATYLLGFIAERKGWTSAFIMLALIAGVSAVVAIAFYIGSAIKTKREAK